MALERNEKPHLEIYDNNGKQLGSEYLKKDKQNAIQEAKQLATLNPNSTITVYLQSTYYSKKVAEFCYDPNDDYLSEYYPKFKRV